ncbi:MAG: MFS transporter [Actinomycetota bacterium]
MQIINENAADKMDKTSLRTTVLLSASHVVNDSYMNLFPPLLPFIIPSLGLGISSIGWLMTFFSVTSSLSQLAIGYLSDRIGGRFFIIMGPLVAAIFMSSLGIITNYYLLIIAVSVAGLGTAAFHPPSSALIGSLNESKSGRLMSLFTLGGNLGWAIMPLIAVPLVAHFGLIATPILAIPGISAALLLYAFVPQLKTNQIYSSSNRSLLKTAVSNPVPFFCLLGSVAFRSLAFF